MKDDDDEEEEEEKENEPIPENLTRRGRRTAVLDSKLRVLYKEEKKLYVFFVKLYSNFYLFSARHSSRRKKKAAPKRIGVTAT